MTIVELRSETAHVVRQHWWTATGVIIAAILIVSAWNDFGSQYLPYVALVTVTVHACLSMEYFDKYRAEHRHRKQIAVAYRAHLKAVQKAQSREQIHATHRPAAGRNGNTPSRVAVPTRRLVGLPAQ